jgi:hypothetical protein
MGIISKSIAITAIIKQAGTANIKNGRLFINLC